MNQTFKSLDFGFVIGNNYENVVWQIKRLIGEMGRLQNVEREEGEMLFLEGELDDWFNELEDFMREAKDCSCEDISEFKKKFHEIRKRFVFEKHAFENLTKKEKEVNEKRKRSVHAT